MEMIKLEEIMVELQPAPTEANVHGFKSWVTLLFNQVKTQLSTVNNHKKYVGCT